MRKRQRSTARRPELQRNRPGKGKRTEAKGKRGGGDRLYGGGGKEEEDAKHLSGKSWYGKGFAPGSEGSRTKAVEDEVSEAAVIGKPAKLGRAAVDRVDCGINVM